MENYFNKYKLGKLALTKMIIQFYDTTLSIAEAQEYGIKFNNYNIQKNEVKCYSHRFEPSGEFIWKELGIEKPIITTSELDEIVEKVSAEREKSDNNKTYYEDYLKMCICAIGIMNKFYSTRVPKKTMKGRYDKEKDIFDNEVCACDNQGEPAGIYAFNLIGLEGQIAPSSEIDAKKKELVKRLLEIKK